jgi:hypothetical protein
MWRENKCPQHSQDFRRDLFRKNPYFIDFPNFSGRHIFNGQFERCILKYLSIPNYYFKGKMH